MAEHFDVLIVGAGISGIAAGYHLQNQSPETKFLILDDQATFGGTWNTHRYPGIRSDSDLYTFGYRFKPWIGPPIATAGEILAYMGEVITENNIDRNIRYQHLVKSANWSNTDKRWTLEGIQTDSSETLSLSANFLWMCQGYYQHAGGYTPDWQGMEDFQGQIIHPQTWPDNLDTSDKKVVVIGSGATAATVVPAIAADNTQVTILQRSPTYYIIRPNVHELAQTLREIQIDETLIHEIVRKRILFEQAAFTQRCSEEPEAVTEELVAMVRRAVGDDIDIDKHFRPKYRPWRQRIAVVPNGDLFKAIRDGNASVMTDQITRFTKNGILLESGNELQADIVVTATGFELNVLGDIDFSIDGVPLQFDETLTYRGMMFTGIPNMVWVFGYFRASWTLRSELVADFVCQLLDHMKRNGARRVEVALRPHEQDMEMGSWVNPDNFNPGYLMRGMHLLPKCGASPEWQHSHDYWADKEEFPDIDLDDKVFVYDSAG